MTSEGRGPVRASVVCLASAKGGSGKTMLTASLATFVGSLGRRVLMVDTDAATNGLTLLYLTQVVAFAHKDERQPVGLFDVDAVDNAPLYSRSDAVPIAENVDLLPATYVGKNTEDVPVSDYLRRLGAVIDSARKDYDLVLLDAQAGADEYARVALSPKISDRALIVSEYDPMSAAGVERLKALLGESLSYSRTWIVLNKMLPDFARSFGEFLEIARYAPPIPWDADVVRAYARRTLALDLEFGNEHTVAIMRVLRTVLADEMGAELDDWATNKAEVLRRPITVTAAELRDQLGGTEFLWRRATLRVERTQRLILMIAFLAVSGMALMTLFDGMLTLAQRSGVAVMLTAAAATMVTVLRIPQRRMRTEIGELDDRRRLLRERLTAYETVADLSLDNLVTHPDRPQVPR